MNVGVPEVHVDSTHPFHAPLHKTLVLLRIANVYFVIEGMAGNDKPDPNEHGEYYYTLHTCPEDYIKGVEAIVQDGDFDPHGCFEYVRSIWMPQRYADAQKIVAERSSNAMGEPVHDLLRELFPELDNQ
ncbi:MAG: hypothetical protein ABR949_10215 [Candidatus Aquilonibacter sp.]|jgi:hypothetical protein